MYILIVEDDKLQYQFLKDALEKSKIFSKARIRRITTESEFQEQFEQIATEQPDAIIMDIMLRWADPTPEMKLPPPGIAEQGFFRAGLRCEESLGRDSRTRAIPVLMYSVLAKEDLDGEISQRKQVYSLEKDFDGNEIVKTLQAILRRR